MPTELPRYSISETPDVAGALDAAAAAWPGEPRSRLLRRLVLVGAETVRADPERRSQTVAKWAGFLPETYPEGAAAALKDEWPE
ncbi:MAG: hypothetical protein LBH48_07395 [Bifidobacteriaceae bacterium]|nr:hypothetical protein [Bifidobacteriaceae bacterium]